MTKQIHLAAHFPGVNNLTVWSDHLGPGGAGRHHEPRDICFSAALRRTHHPHRLVVAGQDHAELAMGLRSWLDGTDSGTTSSSAAADYLAGGDPDWADLVDQGARYVPLPHYPWQQGHYWLEPTEGDR